MLRGNCGDWCEAGDVNGLLVGGHVHKFAGEIFGVIFSVIQTHYSSCYLGEQKANRVFGADLV